MTNKSGSAARLVSLNKNESSVIHYKNRRFSQSPERYLRIDCILVFIIVFPLWYWDMFCKQISEKYFDNFFLYIRMIRVIKTFSRSILLVKNDQPIENK